MLFLSINENNTEMHDSSSKTAIANAKLPMLRCGGFNAVFRVISGLPAPCAYGKKLPSMNT